MITRLRNLHVVLVMLFALPVARAEDGLETYRAQLARVEAALAGEPASTRLLSARGDAHLFLGHFAEAVADYEKMIALDPALDAPHWRLGIAYHFAGQWEKSARQFAKYHAYDGRDRENGVWKFLADAHTGDLAKARREMLPYTEFDREPFPVIYDLLAGRMDAAQFQAHLDKVGTDRHALFYGRYYRGLFAELQGQHEQALADLRAAVGLFRAGSGPDFMWQCARLHLGQMEARAAPR